MTRSRLSGPVSAEDLRGARDEALRSYRRFLSGEDRFGVEASHAFALRDVSVEPDARPRPGRAARKPPPHAAPSPTRKRRPPRARMLAVATAAFAAISLVILVPREEPSRPDVRIAAVNVAAPDAVGDCDAAVEVGLSGTIAVSGPTIVRYHWQDGGVTLATGELDFETEGEKLVTQVATTRPGGADRGGLSLVSTRRSPAGARSSTTSRARPPRPRRGIPYSSPPRGEPWRRRHHWP